MGDAVLGDSPLVGFATRNGTFYCDEIRVDDVIKTVRSTLVPDPDLDLDPSPLFVYSHRQLVANVGQYLQAMGRWPGRFQLNYSIKANANPTLLKTMADMGVSATLVSGQELRLALMAGFEPATMMFNGCGKTPWETKLAIETGVMLNVDSLWDLEQTVRLCHVTGRQAKVLLRINLDIDPRVHQFVNTGHGDSKFGMSLAMMEECLQVLERPGCPCQLLGLHSHLGSTIRHLAPFRQSVDRLLELRRELQGRGFQHLSVINAGGGLGIDYLAKEPETRPWRSESVEAQGQLTSLLGCLTDDGTWDKEVAARSFQTICDHRQTCHELNDLATTIASYRDEKISFSELQEVYRKLASQFPGLAKHLLIVCPCLHPVTNEPTTPENLVSSISELLEADDQAEVKVIVEPGRSLVGNTAILVSRVLGTKQARNTNFVFVDASMTEVIRPALYAAYHHVTIVPDHSVADLKEDDQKEADRKEGDRKEADLKEGDRKEAVQKEGDRKEKCVYDVVGPVCESADVIAKDRLFPRVHGGLALVHDVGAYCHSMASNYNLRLRPGEVLIQDGRCKVIRRPDRFTDLLDPYTDLGTDGQVS